ncbi:MAG: recombinase family protein [Bacteroidetes bacterium]|nr:recombinase family protein [Bacteroidota bacterium]
MDRFSRSGANAIYIADQLQIRGIKIIAVSQQVDTSTASGVLQQSILFSFSQYDNDLRKNKCIAGMKEKLFKGEWLGCAPRGYTLTCTNGVQKITINEIGKLIAKAFLWKAEERLSNIEIVNRLRTMGLIVHPQWLSAAFRNLFYCGLITHNFLNGEIVKGKHEALVSYDTFLKVNNLLKDNAQGYTHKKADIDLPLNKFMTCEVCGTRWTGYVVKNKGKYYYKCNRIGCKCNKNAEKMHDLFKQELNKHTPEIKHHQPLTMQLKLTFEYMNKQNEENRHLLKIKLNEIDEKLNKVQERFAIGEIDKEIYEKVGGKIKQEKSDIEQEYEKAQIKLSNLEKYTDYILRIAENLSKLWDFKDISVKQNLQHLVFPEGVSYDKKNHVYRTPKVNSVFNSIAGISRSWEKNKGGKINMLTDLSALVAGIGKKSTRLIKDFLKISRFAISISD